MSTGFRTTQHSMPADSRAFEGSVDSVRPVVVCEEYDVFELSYNGLEAP